MIIPKVDPLQFAVTELALPEVKSLAEAMKKKEGADFATETFPSKKTPAEVLQEMIHITTFEMMKSEIFFPEDDQAEE